MIEKHCIKFCIYCHFTNNYDHYHQEKWNRYNEETEKVEFFMVDVFDGNWTDENKICLPCQAMRRFNV